ncbi:MAG: nucleotidyltransferase domain-containing protein [Sporolactobacillus sp.]
MNERSQQLIRLAKEWIRNTCPEIANVSVSGSVARGQADKYSDVDLTLFGNCEEDKTIEYKSEILQLHFGPIPKIEQIYRSPWEHRSFSEIEIIQDKDELLKKTKEKAIDYFNTTAGRKKMIHVSTRFKTSYVSVKTNVSSNVVSCIASNGKCMAKHYGYFLTLFRVKHLNNFMLNCQ